MTNPLDLSGRTIVVTGASSGIGRDTALLLSELGARVVLVARNLDRLNETARMLEGGCCRVAPFDLAKLDEIPGWFSALVEELGPFDGLAHCAGVAPLAPLQGLKVPLLDEVMKVNFSSAVILTKEFARKKAHQPASSIVFTASVAGLLGAPARSLYGASKGALIAFAKSAAMELAKSGIRVNCVAPSYVQTEMYEKTTAGLAPEQLADLVRATQPLGLGRPRDVANAIVFLIADTGRWITGTVLAVDGGYAAQ